MCSNVNLCALPAVQWWQTHKDILLETSRIVRDLILKTTPGADLAQEIAMVSLARALWQDDCNLARAVLATFSKGRKFSLDGGWVTLRDPQGFADAFDEIAAADAAAEALRRVLPHRSPRSSAPGRAPSRAKHSYASRLLRSSFWAPS